MRNRWLAHKTFPPARYPRYGKGKWQGQGKRAGRLLRPCRCRSEEKLWFCEKNGCCSVRLQPSVCVRWSWLNPSLIFGGRSMKIVVLRVRYDSVRNASESEIQGCWAENLWMMRSYEVIINNLRIAIFEWSFVEYSSSKRAGEKQVNWLSCLRKAL